MENKFPSILAALTSEENKSNMHLIESINECKSINDLLSKWSIKELIPDSSKRKQWANVSDLKNYLIKRAAKKLEKAVEKHYLHLINVSKHSNIIDAHISIEWKDSKMWGMNPTGSADVRYNMQPEINENVQYDTFYSGSIGGCGYDKLSTAVARSLNQSYSLKYMMYTLKESNVTAKNSDIFGYGSGYGVLPYIEGGVGDSCYPEIFDKIGLTFKRIATGKKFDVYTITQKLNNL